MAVSFGAKDLTEFIPSTITQLYGEAASGKTNLCILAAADVVRSGKKVIFIDTEGSFSVPRFRQVAPTDANELLKNIAIAEPSDFDEQKIAINKAEDLAAKGDVGLVIVDSLVSLYRTEMGSSEEAQTANRELSRQLSKLMKIAKKHKIPVVVTNQVYSSFSKDGEESKIVPVGRDVLRYWTKAVIQLTKEGSLRTATVVRHPFKPEGSSLSFKITNTGIEYESPSHNTSREV